MAEASSIAFPRGIKLASAVAFVFAIALAPRPAWAVYGAGAVTLLAAGLATRIPLLQLGRRLLLVEPLALGVALLSLLQRDGLLIFTAMLARSTLCLFCMVVLSSTTRFSEILGVLRAIRVPALLLTTLALMHRYLFLLVDETGTDAARTEEPDLYAGDPVGLARIGQHDRAALRPQLRTGGADLRGDVRAGVEDVNAIDVRGLDYRYPDGTAALRDVSFSVSEGERVGLIGPNGAGKSTLLLHLNGLLPEHASGPPAVHVFGTPVGEPHLRSIRAEVGLLFQDPDDQLFCPTVREDVAFGPQQLGVRGDELAGRVARALEQVGLGGFEERLPHHLSRGEKRRVCLAGLLASDARLLALDEPTSDLDPRGRRELKALLSSLRIAQVIATHDLELVVEICPRVIVIDAGTVVAQGSTVELLSDEALMLAHGLERPHILRHSHPH